MRFIDWLFEVIPLWAWKVMVILALFGTCIGIWWLKVWLASKVFWSASG